MSFTASYSFLNAEENCPHKAHHIYILKDVPFEETPDTIAGNKLHKAMERRINENQKLPDDLGQMEAFAKSLDAMKEQGKTVRAELMLAVDNQFRPVDYWAKPEEGNYLRGKLDVAIYRTDVQASNAVIFDWKNNSKPREDPFELAVHAVLLKSRLPTLQYIDGYYVWCKHNRLGDRHDVSDTERTEASIRSQLNIVSNRGDNWPKRQNPLCGWCPVVSCEFNRKGKA